MNQKELLVIACTIFLTVVAWVMFEVYGIKQNTLSEEQIQSFSLNYNIDTTVLDELKTKQP
ncbi:MAG: hypothetical protein ACEQSA_02835 [Weeksellaceae bacterium]